MILLRTASTAALLAASFAFLPAAALAQQNIEPAHAGAIVANSPATTGATYPTDQILTATVHQAWLLSGKDESKFFDIVQQLAEISAKNREITLPDSATAGRQMGNYIKRNAKLDTDQLLFAVVDKAVVMVAHVPAHPAKSTTAKQ